MLMLSPFSVAYVVCQLKVDVQCDSCKDSLMDVLGSIYGVYSVSIEVLPGGRDGIAKVEGKVNPNTLMSAIAKSGRHTEGRHAELLNVKISHPKFRNCQNNSIGNHNYNNYGQSGSLPAYNSNGYKSLEGYGRSESLPALAYHEVDQDYGRQPLAKCYCSIM